MATDVRQRVAEACRILAANRQEHFYLGHVSGREAPGSERYWVKPTGIGLGEVVPEDLVLVNLSGQRISGTRALHHELPIHTEIYRRRPDVNCVVHTHPFHAAAFASASAGFRMVSQDSVLFADGVGFYDSAVLVVTTDQGRRVAEALGPLKVVLMRNHGIAAAADTVEGATFFAVSFDRSLQLQATAASFGPISEISRDEVAAMNDYFDASYGGRVEATFEYLLRQADAPSGRRSESQRDDPGC
jgi:L-fuculose-phosphate aldolase